jgi:hypothetical protein
MAKAPERMIEYFILMIGMADLRRGEAVDIVKTDCLWRKVEDDKGVQEEEVCFGEEKKLRAG